MGIIAMIGVVAGSQFLRQAPHQKGLSPYGVDRSEPQGPASKVSGFTLREAVRTSQFWTLGTFYFIYLICHTAVTVHIVIYATGMGVPAMSAARLLSVFGAFLIVGFILIGMIADRISNRFGFTISFILSAVAFILMLLIRDVWVLYLFMAVLGFACGGMQVLFSPIVAELFGLSSHGVILATASFLGGFGSALGPPMAGYIHDVTGSYSLSFVICAILSVVAIVFALTLRPIIVKGETDEP